MDHEDVPMEGTERRRRASSLQSEVQRLQEQGRRASDAAVENESLPMVAKVPTDPLLIQQLNQRNEEVERNFSVVEQTFVQQQEAFMNMSQTVENVHLRAEERTLANRTILEEEREARRLESLRRDALLQQQNQTTNVLIEELQKQRAEKQQLELMTKELFQKLEVQTVAHQQALFEAAAAVNANRRDVETLLKERKRFAETRWQHFAPQTPRGREHGSTKMPSRMQKDLDRKK